MTLRGTDRETVQECSVSGEPFPGGTGFAGECDGRLVRDVLGREPLFLEAGEPAVWSHDPTTLAVPERVPAGHARDADGVEHVWSLPDPVPLSDPDRAIDSLREAIEQTIAEIDTTGLAVAFSGGVDSALLAACLDAPLYTAGFPGSHDLQAARTAGEFLDTEVRTVELDHTLLERAVPRIARVTCRTNAMDVQIALALFAVGERAENDGFDRLALGQGADELFGGYTKIAQAPEDHRVSADTIRGARRELLGTLPAQLERDILTLRATGVEPVTPLLHDRVIEAGLQLPGELLVSDRGDRKWAFRRAVRPWVPDSVAFREKKAVQYGSLAARELDRLARQDGFKRQMDDHVSQYIQHRLSE